MLPHDIIQRRKNAGGQRPLVSYCTACYNRHRQLLAVLHSNLDKIHGLPDVEWIILDYGSTDGTLESLATQIPKDMQNVVVACEMSQHPWNLSIAKNMAHRLAAGDILVNLDCDNFIDDSTNIIKTFFEQGCRVLHLWSGLSGDGTCGRIAIAHDVFHAIGGYNEEFYPMGYQDHDLLKRAASYNVPVIHYRGAARAVVNSKLDSIRNCHREDFTWQDYNHLNRVASERNIASGKIRANDRAGWTAMTIQLLL